MDPRFPHKSVTRSLSPTVNPPDPELLAQLHDHLREAINVANTLALQDWTERTGAKDLAQDKDGTKYLLAADQILHAHRYLHACIEGTMAPFVWDPETIARMRARTRADMPAPLRPYYPLDCEGGINEPTPVHWGPTVSGVTPVIQPEPAPAPEPQKAKGRKSKRMEPAPAPAPAPVPTPISFRDLREAQVTRIRELHKLGNGLKKIAKILNEEGRQGPGGGMWHPTSVGRVLRAER